MKVFGVHVSLEVVLLCLIIGAILGRVFLCDLLHIDGPIKEGMESMLGFAPLDYKMGTGVGQSWENRQIKDTTQQKMESYHAGQVPLPEGEMDMFYDNEFKPECCPANYSSSTGCACISKEQMDYLNQRGGNRTFPTEF